MENKIQILQIGLEDWTPFLTDLQKEKLEWIYLDLKSATTDSVKHIMTLRKRGAFSGVLCTDALNNQILELLELKIEAYSLILDERLEKVMTAEMKKKKFPLFMNLSNKQKIIEIFVSSFFEWQGGSTLHTNTIMVHPQFKGEKTLFGESFLRLDGDYQSLKNAALLTWQMNMGFMNQISRKIYLQIEHEEGVRIHFVVDILQQGSSELIDRRVYDEKAINEGIDIQYKNGFGSLGFSLIAEGEGRIEVGILHIQDSRNGLGDYLLGGKRIKDKHNQDLYYYFNPGDLKPPLTVYFAGFHTGKSFEAFYRMKKSGAPFLLITDSRLAGGAFYIGSPELEGKMVQVVENSLSYLGFTHKELILSGLSMGSYGALYYAQALTPHAVLAGKAIANLGDVIQNDRLIRPGGFAVGLDIQYSLTGGLSEKESQQLNERFWTVFDRGSYEQTTFVIAHMLNEDYDINAYRDIREHLISKNSRLISKGIVGRHGDNNRAINDWFFGQHQRILREDFERE